MIVNLEENLNSEDRPKIVCLCGSTKFAEAYKKVHFDETLKGNIVLTIGCNTKLDPEFKGMSEIVLNNIKENLYRLHLWQIKLADEVIILNVDGYLGDSTKKELEFARVLRKNIRFYEPIGAPYLRDPESPCDAFMPIKIYGDWLVKECATDDHYLCKECRFRVPQTEEEVEELNKKLKGDK